jgi:hypothetical protein
MMNNLSASILKCLCIVVLSFSLGCQPGCTKGTNTTTTATSSSLEFNNSSNAKIDTVFPNTPIGNLVRQHIATSMGHGEDAEARYQQSLSTLRAESEAPLTLYNAYKKLAPENYFYRNLIVEALKEVRSNNALEFLREIANEKIPEDRAPENAELDTRQDEIMIRITAVEGIAFLAAARNEQAERTLNELISHEDLTVRQMATRGYLQSPFGIQAEKMQELRQRIPAEEHWYITAESTDIKKAVHPEMPLKFDLKEHKTNQAPKIKSN